MNIHPLIIVFLSITSIIVDYWKYRRDPYSPLWSFALRFFVPPMYLIYFYTQVWAQNVQGVYNANAVAPLASVGFLLFLIPNFLLLCITIAGEVRRRNKHTRQLHNQ